ncbi:YitT family protein [Lentilactobacillus otakiensis]|uniref:YitT family protein n=1 Tax=Lentilactobacillus otakiensis TaxID=481720 RepID=UPI003D186BD9
MFLINKTIIRNGLQIILGAFIYAIAINDFLIPHQIGEGGVTGLTTIGYYALSIPPAVTNFVLNGILMLVGFRFLSKKTVWYSLWAVVWISIFLKLPRFLNYQTTQTIIPAIAGGVLMGISMWIIFRGEGTIAGSTILAKIMNRYFGMKNGSAMLMFDLCVAIPSVFIIGFQNMILTVIELYVSAVVLNGLLSRFGARKAVTIISKQTDEITSEMSEMLHQGITLVSAKGYYHQEKRPIIYLICTDKQVAQIVPLVSSVDPDAFVVVDNVHSVKGEALEKIL